MGVSSPSNPMRANGNNISTRNKFVIEFILPNGINRIAIDTIIIDKGMNLLRPCLSASLPNVATTINSRINDNNTIISNFCDSDGDGLPDNAFIIDDTGSGDYTWAQASSQSWVRGSGVWNDPYVIENLTIDGRNTTTGIEIRNSYAYFIIRNCWVRNGSSENYNGILWD